MVYDPGINDSYCRLSPRADLLYEFVMEYSNYIYSSRDYLPGQSYNMIEIHTLTYISDNPGTTVTQLASFWNKTKSALSQIVKKLVEQGLVERSFADGNKKTTLLHVTPAGHQLSQVHKAYDVADITETQALLLNSCRTEDIDTFYHVLSEYLKLLKIV